MLAKLGLLTGVMGFLKMWLVASLEQKVASLGQKVASLGPIQGIVAGKARQPTLFWLHLLQVECALLDLLLVGGGSCARRRVRER